MGHLSVELNTHQLHWALVAPNGTALTLGSEEISFQGLQSGGKNMRGFATRSSQSVVASLVGIDLGTRGGGNVSLLSLGFDLEKSQKIVDWPQTDSVFDVQILFFPLTHDTPKTREEFDEFLLNFERFLSFAPVGVQQTPTVFTGGGWDYLLTGFSEDPSLEICRGFLKRACLEWMERRFPKRRILPDETRFFVDSLDWILSFS